jgi:hypothetical protein
MRHAPVPEKHVVEVEYTIVNSMVTHKRVEAPRNKNIMMRRIYRYNLQEAGYPNPKWRCRLQTFLVPRRVE